MAQALGSSSAGNTTTASPRKRRNYFITFWDQAYKHSELPQHAQYLIECDDMTADKKWHGHAFIYFKNQIAFTTVKKLFGATCHVEIPQINSRCIAYVRGEITHDEDPDATTAKTNVREFGEPPNDNGVHKMSDVLKLNSITEVMEFMPDTYVKYRRGINDLMEHKKSKNRYFKQPRVIWIYGGTGRGKTREAFEAGAINVTYEHGFFSDWGDARVICIEELRGEIPYRELLKLLDGYHNYYFVNIKGGQKFIDLDAIYITSPYHPRKVYVKQNTREDSIDQLLRRITELKYVGGTGSIELPKEEEEESD